MQLRKIVNHPYLFLDEYLINDDLYRVAGKFEVLDRMLPKFLHFKHKILIFSQMTQLMDIFGDYLTFKGIKYHRLDGAIGLQERKERMDFFNDPEDDTLVFMLSTRAGGLGLNLQAADTVILFDSDFNPHQDLQAACRAHRVGQQNEVRVFRLITISGVEELILTKAQHKLNIDEKVIQAGMFNTGSTDEDREERLRSILGGKFSKTISEATTPQELNRYMARTEAEEEWFESYDRKLFGDHMDRFCLNESSTAETTNSFLPPATKKHPSQETLLPSSTQENDTSGTPDTSCLMDFSPGEIVGDNPTEENATVPSLSVNTEGLTQRGNLCSSSPSPDSHPIFESVPPSSLTSLDELPPPSLIADAFTAHSASSLPPLILHDDDVGCPSDLPSPPPLETEASPGDPTSSDTSMAEIASPPLPPTATPPDEATTAPLPFPGEDSHSEVDAAMAPPPLRRKKEKRGARSAITPPIEAAEWVDWRRSGRVASVLILCSRLMSAEDLPPWIVVDDEEEAIGSQQESSYDETLAPAAQTGLMARTSSGSSISSLLKTSGSCLVESLVHADPRRGDTKDPRGAGVRFPGRGRGRGMKFALENSARRLRSRRENRVMYNDTLSEAKFLRVVERLGAGNGTNLEEALREEMQRAEARKEKRGVKRRLKETLKSHPEDMFEGRTVEVASPPVEAAEGDAPMKRKRRSWTRRIKPQSSDGPGRPYRRCRNRGGPRTFRNSTEGLPTVFTSSSGTLEKEGFITSTVPPLVGRRRSGRPRLHRTPLPAPSLRMGGISPIDEEVEEAKEIGKSDVSSPSRGATETNSLPLKPLGPSLRLRGGSVGFPSFRRSRLRGRSRASVRGIRRSHALRSRSTRFSLNTTCLVPETVAAKAFSMETKPLSRLIKKRNLDTQEGTPASSDRFVGELDFASPNYSSAGESSDAEERQKLSSSLSQINVRKGSRESSSQEEEKPRVARNHRKAPKLRRPLVAECENEGHTFIKSQSHKSEVLSSGNISSVGSRLSSEANASAEEFFSAGKTSFPLLSSSETAFPLPASDSHCGLFPEDSTKSHIPSGKDESNSVSSSKTATEGTTSRSPSLDPAVAPGAMLTATMASRVEIPKYVPPDSSNATLRWGKRGSKPHGICLLDAPPDSDKSEQTVLPLLSSRESPS
ncbi:hypothetical protein IE077_000222 [Cardiosporidium cionae]|uniref:Helicase C-terminal domain-containing protein n=1 Tax=Cardiosporidium cionae TaxID=476202 RepID=A0ABQ7J4X2_9APIC|nr:hypothetical protein IE077_000222 [Cardiosporidium cionae]|eukprot:KAF8819061.1 hypothetical protein IE077_000222 [Cardiosporidium cionae]